jgi:hypothetical protein
VPPCHRFVAISENSGALLPNSLLRILFSTPSGEAYLSQVGNL